MLGFDSIGQDALGEFPGAAANTILIAAAGVYTFTGRAVNFLATRRLPIATGAFAFAGGAVNLLEQHKMPVVAGIYAFTGRNVGLLATRHLPIATGVYILTGRFVFPRVNISRGEFILLLNQVGLLRAILGPKLITADPPIIVRATSLTATDALPDILTVSPSHLKRLDNLFG
jgi:hypothetical protein